MGNVEFDAAEWEPLIRRRVHAYCRGPLPTHTTHDDLVQDTLIAVWRSLPHYPGFREGLPAWVTAIARRRVADAYRAATRRPADLVANVDDVVTTDADEVESAALVPDVAGLLTHLDNPRHREVLALRAQDLTYRQIADTLGMTLSAVKMTIHHARCRMSGEPLHKQQVTRWLNVADIQWAREHLDRDLGFLVAQLGNGRPIPPIVLRLVHGAPTVADWPSARRLAAAHLAEDRVRTVWAPLPTHPISAADPTFSPHRATV